MRIIELFVALALGSMAILLLHGCADTSGAPTYKVNDGNAKRGRVLIAQYGCGSCHSVPGVSGARGKVGPPLMDFGERVYVAGMLRNTPDNLIYWLRNPQRVVPGNAMPNMGVTDRDARDLAAFLYTLR